jgi:hypothetical protein
MTDQQRAGADPADSPVTGTATPDNDRSEQPLLNATEIAAVRAARRVRERRERLIEAAPDLLAVLKDVAELYGKTGDLEYRTPFLWRRIKWAITKAEGY